ncbi:TVP38/TMEM64 family protein [Novosphingobium beihaiensis]|uniref:TVP38/TMEM64 family membrane protein n=1 Tax=Novosphingobium beihaiensis TaxID=2930389 RepID=A0ABT0BLA3_9SPHN|nr:TVP38/TMEM64 family protein [Novosphingobium beihaiensis]MCJ2185814.1 TVP38/TMEM64 family protein [Novosphingobium beihaiensis]
MAKSSSLKRWAPLGVAAACLVAFFALGGPKYISLEWMQQNRDWLSGFASSRPLTAFLLMIVIYAGLVAISFPGASLLTIFAGFMFGAWVGTGAVVLGATIGAVAIFVMARSTFGDALARKAGSAVDKLREGFERDETSYLLILRLAPAFPFWLVNIAAGLLGARLRTFAWTTLVGIVPGSFVYASIGAGAGALLDAGKSLSLAGALTRTEVILPIAGLIVLSLLPMALRRIQGRRQDATHG